LNQNEINDIKNKVFELKPLWEYRRIDMDVVQSKLTVYTRVLSTGMYTRDYESYVKNVEKIKPIMGEYFQVYYDKIKLTLEEYYKKPVNFLDNVNYPGFHIFAPQEDQKLGRVTKFNFHKDKFGYLNKFILPGYTVSVIIPIIIPNIGGSLLYTEKDEILTTDDIVAGNYTKFQYTAGMLAIWGGDIVHSIEPMFFTPGECRITLQMHLNINDNGIHIFW
jgi:hypothetical protein